MKQPKPGQILNQLLEMEAGPVNRAMRLRELERMCTDGYTTEVNTARGDVVEVTQKDPKTAQSCNVALGHITNRYEDLAMDEVDGDRSVNINIVNLIPEDEPAVTD